jgi:hypothetical protein
MKENPRVQLDSIAAFSGISMGSLVSWRKKYGDYLGIKTKNSDPAVTSPNNGMQATAYSVRCAPASRRA